MTGKKPGWTVVITTMLMVFFAFGQPKKVKLLTFRYLSKLDYQYGKTPVPPKLLKLEGTWVFIQIF